MMMLDSTEACRTAAAQQQQQQTVVMKPDVHTSSQAKSVMMDATVIWWAAAVRQRNMLGRNAVIAHPQPRGACGGRRHQNVNSNMSASIYLHACTTYMHATVL
jgi:hypothetical protein